MGSKADRLLLYPNKYSLDVSLGTVESRLLVKARDELNVTLKAIRVQHENMAACEFFPPSLRLVSLFIFHLHLF
mgnify:FL=1